MSEVRSRAAGSADPGGIAQRHQRLFVPGWRGVVSNGADCRAFVGAGLLLHTLFVAVRLMLLVVGDGRSVEHSALFAAWQMLC